jgi:hypothetical protein
MFKKALILGLAVIFAAGIVMMSAAVEPAFAQSCKKTCTSSAAFSSAKKDECKTPCAETSKAACKGAAACCASSQCKTAQKQNEEAIRKISADLPYHESKRLVMTGEYVCGKCDLSKMESCQGFLKTAQGDLYPLLKGAKTKMMGKLAHTDTNTFEIVGRVKVLDGVKYIEVTSVTVL